MTQSTLHLTSRVTALRRAMRDIAALAADLRHDIRTPEQVLDQIERAANHALREDDTPHKPGDQLTGAAAASVATDLARLELDPSIRRRPDTRRFLVEAAKRLREQSEPDIGDALRRSALDAYRAMHLPMGVAEAEGVCAECGDNLRRHRMSCAEAQKAFAKQHPALAVGFHATA